MSPTGKLSFHLPYLPYCSEDRIADGRRDVGVKFVRLVSVRLVRGVHTHMISRIPIYAVTTVGFAQIEVLDLVRFDQP